MKRTILIDGCEMEFAANAATPIRYKQVFNEDLLKVAQELENADYYGVVTKLAYIMHAQADGKGYKGMSFDAFADWLEGFSSMAFMNVAEDIINLWTESEETKSRPKKQ